MRRAAGWLLALTLAGPLASACGGASDQKPGAPDSTVFGDDRRREGKPGSTVPDVALLERLVDEYEGLDVVMDELAGSPGGRPARHHAWKGDRHEDDAKQRLLDLLQAEFGERYQPQTPEGAARTADSIGALAEDAGKRALDTLVLEHHRRVHAEIGDALPSVRNARVREELVRLQQHLADEIRKLSGGSPPSATG